MEEETIDLNEELERENGTTMERKSLRDGGREEHLTAPTLYLNEGTNQNLRNLDIMPDFGIKGERPVVDASLVDESSIVDASVVDNSIISQIQSGRHSGTLPEQYRVQAPMSRMPKQMDPTYLPPTKGNESRSSSADTTTIIDGVVYNDRGYVVCGHLNQHNKRCLRIGKCPFHNTEGKKEPRSHNSPNNNNQHPHPVGKKPPSKTSFKQGWTRDEHMRFLHGLRIHGKSAWKEIALIVGTRTPTQIQSHAQKYYLRQKQQAKKRSIHDITLDDLPDSKNSWFDPNKVEAPQFPMRQQYPTYSGTMPYQPPMVDIKWSLQPMQPMQSMQPIQSMPTMQTMQTMSMPSGMPDYYRNDMYGLHHNLPLQNMQSPNPHTQSVQSHNQNPHSQGLSNHQMHSHNVHGQNVSSLHNLPNPYGSNHFSPPLPPVAPLGTQQPVQSLQSLQPMQTMQNIQGVPGVSWYSYGPYTSSPSPSLSGIPPMEYLSHDTKDLSRTQYYTYPKQSEEELDFRRKRGFEFLSTEEQNLPNKHLRQEITSEEEKFTDSEGSDPEESSRYLVE